jgi:hypothetical protein
VAGAADLATSTPAANAAGKVTQLTLAKDAYQKAIARIGNKRSQTLQQYGYRATGYDDLGNPTGLQVDQFNQFGEFQKMLHDDALLSMQAQDDAIGRGLGGAGLGNQAESEARYQHGERSYEMGRLFQNEFTGINEERLQADQEYAQAQWEAQRQAALDAIAAQQFGQPAYDAPAYPDYDWTDPTGSDTPPPVVAAPSMATPYIDAAAAAVAGGYGGYVHSAGQTETNRALEAARKALARRAV